MTRATWAKPAATTRKEQAITSLKTKFIAGFNVNHAEYKTLRTIRNGIWQKSHQLRRSLINTAEEEAALKSIVLVTLDKNSTLLFSSEAREV